MELELSAGSARMRVMVVDDSGLVPSLLLNSRIRAVGVCEGVYADGEQKQAGLLSVLSWKQIEPMELATWSIGLEHPVTSVRDLTLTGVSEPVVHLSGQVRSVERDSGLVIEEDETGQIVVQTTQTPAGIVGAKVEALGKWKRVGTKVILQGAFYRQASETSQAPPETLPVLTTAEQIQRLKPEEAKSAIIR